jgi:uncharacterized phage-associated protein
MAKYAKEQIDKLGNTIIYLTQERGLSKTKLLKIIYLLDEYSIKEHGIPYFNFNYKIWKFGPVVEDLFIEFSSRPVLLKDYIERVHDQGRTFIKGKGVFNDDEFSDNDLEILELISEKFKNSPADWLVKVTHHANSLWAQVAKENALLSALEREEISNTDLDIPFLRLVEGDPVKAPLYYNYLEQFGPPS